MKRLLLIGVLLGTMLVAATPASAQRFRSYYRAPVYAPRTTYWGGYYPSPGYMYQPYTSYYYSYPRGPAWGYPRYYSNYPAAPYYYYGW
jgi:hypothetical protein